MTGAVGECAGCGVRSCPRCGPAARAAAATAEATANQAPAEGDGEQPAGAAGSAIVEMTVFGRTVRVEAPEPLERVSSTAVALWQHLDEPPRAPVGAAGFVLGEQLGPPPADMDMPLADPWVARVGWGRRVH